MTTEQATELVDALLELAGLDREFCEAQITYNRVPDLPSAKDAFEKIEKKFVAKRKQVIEAFAKL